MTAIRFGTDGWRATQEAFTTDRVRSVGQAVATYLDDDGSPGAVGIGYDARRRSREFGEELGRVVAGNGRDVLLSARDCPTPLVAWAIAQRDLAGGLMVTASHNPPEYNGVKFITGDGTPALPDVTDALEARLAAPTDRAESARGTITEVDFAPSHAEHARELVARWTPGPTVNLGGLRVAYDAMYGSGRGVTDALLERAGAAVEGLRTERDPSFGGGSPNPTPDRLDALVEAVSSGAAIGIANDGDADRIAVVTPDRGVLDANLLFAVLYDFLLETETGPAVRTVSTTFLIDRIADAHGEAVIEVPVGFKWVARAMGEADALIGGEESGGFSVRGHVREKDGVLLALLVAAAEAERPLDDRVDALVDAHGAVHQGKRGIDCDDDRKSAALDALATDLPESVAGVAVATVNDADGLKVLLEDGSWLLVRPSGTEPKLRIYAEADRPGRVETLLEAGEALVATVV